MANRFQRHQIEILKVAFAESRHLTRERKLHLARVTGLDMEQVSSWFNRKRARKRAKESKRELQRINSELTESLQQLQEEENNLREELQASRARKAALVDENQLLKQRIAVLECDYVSLGWLGSYTGILKKLSVHLPSMK